MESKMLENTVEKKVKDNIKEEDKG